MTTCRRTLVLFTRAAVVLPLLSGSISAQEKPEFRLPDSIRVIHEPFFLPSFTRIPPRFLEDQLSLEQQAGSYNAEWRRSFLLGAALYKPGINQLSAYAAKKETFFEKIQAALGVAEFAGAGYLAYKALTQEPVTEAGKKNTHQKK